MFKGESLKPLQSEKKYQEFLDRSENMKRVTTFCRFLFLCLLFASTGCDSKNGRSERDRIADCMIIDFANTLSVKGFHLIGIGGGLNHVSGKHALFNIRLTTKDTFTEVDIARELFVAIADSFIDFVNHYEGIRNDLDVFPITISNVNLGLIFSDAKPGNIGFVHNCSERLFYYKETSLIPYDPCEKIHEETFEQAHSRIKKSAD